MRVILTKGYDGEYTVAIGPEAYKNSRGVELELDRQQVAGLLEAIDAPARLAAEIEIKKAQLVAFRAPLDDIYLKAKADEEAKAEAERLATENLSTGVAV